MTHFCLVRHGQTDWNLEGRYQGQSDVPLNEKGHAQAKSIADQLCEYTFAAIFSSDLGRARQTAESIANGLGLTVQFDPRLREIRLGVWEGILVTEIKERYEQMWEQRLVDPANSRPPGGETVHEVATRVYAALDDVSRLFPAENILIVSHGLSIATAICRAQNIPIGQAYTVVPENVSPIWVEWEPG